MSGLSYVGAQPSAPNDIANRLQVINLLNAVTPNRASVSAQVSGLVGTTYATKAYVDQQDATFALPSYYQSQDALNLPTSAVGKPYAVSGVTSLLPNSTYYGAASLDANSRVPAAQMPALGAGYLQGPWGPTATASGSTGTTPIKIADWNIGLAGLSFRPLVFMSAFVTATMAHPVIEIRIANSTTAPSYNTSTPVAQGMGRYLYNDYHAVAVVPIPDTTGETPSLLPPTYNVWLTAWLYDTLGLNGATVGIASGIANAAAFLLRGSQ